MNKKKHDIRVCSYCGKTEKNIVIFHCLILWHFDCSLDIFNFSLRGTKIHPKKTAFFRSIKSFIFLKYMPRLHLLPSRISKFSGPPTNYRTHPSQAYGLQACPVSAYFQKFSIYLKTFWEPCVTWRCKWLQLQLQKFLDPQKDAFDR
jgi:hypothetical protein